jgi:hypothetical protein
MRTPGFSAESSLYTTSSVYGGVAAASDSGGMVIPAIPPCRNCDYICDVCLRRHVACGACRLCSLGYCDPSPAGWGGPTE